MATRPPLDPDSTLNSTHQDANPTYTSRRDLLLGAVSMVAATAVPAIRAVGDRTHGRVDGGLNRREIGRRSPDNCTPHGGQFRRSGPGLESCDRMILTTHRLERERAMSSRGSIERAAGGRAP